VKVVGKLQILTGDNLSNGEILSSFSDGQLTIARMSGNSYM
jgi:hypothetical protein